MALRTSFFHNGALHSLRDAVAFYATRDTDPARWYARNADGSVHAYDDLPADAAAHVNRELPFAPRPTAGRGWTSATSTTSSPSCAR